MQTRKNHISSDHHESESDYEEMQESNEWMKIEKSRNDVTKNAKSCGRMKKTYEN